MRVHYKDLRIGDTVRLNYNGTWNTAVVQNITKDSIEFYRPYVVQGNYVTTAGVGLSIGIEMFSDWASRDATLEVINRNEDLQ